ncbi:anti-sigma regulatory factor, serine/threonine protein kinase [Candidatus Omnitrophus magneticus]|uniref:Anti-sigma regulatory factor, serine/threonine protein kinase n=1 Tax=Candidatus Omnitrophus magneticus TaxID=1609969 RepID=A0A0F0CLH5_9BACT|nr:anti-sigma regulatory factor, serine/threonine protein kinase [Candidatus Omnitrophus magneticus]
MATEIHLEIPNSSLALRETSLTILEGLHKYFIPKEVIFDIQVAFEEAVRNAMLHGNKLSDDKKVKIDVVITEQEITIKVEDQGEGYDPSLVPDPTLEENLLKESGRGVYMIKHLMDNVSYEKQGRKIIMNKRFGRINKGDMYACGNN